MAQGQEQGHPPEERASHHGLHHGWGHLLRVPGRLRSLEGQEHHLGDLRRRITHTHTRRIPHWYAHSERPHFLFTPRNPVENPTFSSSAPFFLELFDILRDGFKKVPKNDYATGERMVRMC